jgi:hypothetical protein
VFFVTRRATLLIPSGPADDVDRKHLFVAMTNPVGESREVLLAPVSSVVEGRFVDPGCRLHLGDHPFIRHESFVNYRFLRIETEERLSRGVAGGVLVPKDPLATEVFSRLCHGMTISIHVAPRFLSFFERSV